jgi:hypothetical protein
VNSTPRPRATLRTMALSGGMWGFPQTCALVYVKRSVSLCTEKSAAQSGRHGIGMRETS